MGMVHYTPASVCPGSTSSMARISSVVFLSLQLCLWTSAVCAVPAPARRFTINLDLDPMERWTEVVKAYAAEIPYLLKAIATFVPPEVLELAKIIGNDIEKYMPYPYSMEMVGLGVQANVSVGEVVLGNLVYEVTAFGKSSNSKACTSIVAEAENGTIYHGRNLDYSIAYILRNVTIMADFQRNGKTVYTGTTFGGFIGLLTGQKPNGFTVSLDERDQGDWWMNALEALVAGTHGISSFLIRDTLDDPNSDFESAINTLAYKPLIAPSYIIVGGVGPRQGAVITRDRIAALDIWRLNPIDGRWFLVETNYDHWEPPPPDDDRRDPAIQGMNETGRENLSGISLFRVLSTPPVLNNGTSYTTIMSAAIPDLYNTWVRHP